MLGFFLAMNGKHMKYHWGILKAFLSCIWNFSGFFCKMYMLLFLLLMRFPNLVLTDDQMYWNKSLCLLVENGRKLQFGFRIHSWMLYMNSIIKVFMYIKSVQHLVNEVFSPEHVKHYFLNMIHLIIETIWYLSIMYTVSAFKNI